MKFCIIIPVYRHAAILKEVIDRIITFNISIIIIDDGNSESEKLILQELAKNEIVTLIHNGSNLGKGAAIINGLNYAKKAGFTHALQIDADAQHCIEDIPKFIESSRNNPELLILGKPIFDDSAPLSRIWGRKLTTWIVWLETLSFQVEDGLFGYRIYPLEKTLEVIKDFEIEKRMGFDTEIIVRLVRSGVKVLNIPTKVIYPENGISNFKYFSDNLNLVAMHLRLLFTRQNKKSNWHNKKEHGTILALRTVLVLYRIGGKKLLDILIYPVILYFYIKDTQARKSSRDYLNRALGKDQGSVFKHFVNFGQKIISSLQGWLGEIHPRDIDWHGRNMVYELIEQKKGALVLSAHFGCLEVTRATQSHKKGFKIIPLMYFKNSQIFRRFLREINPKTDQEIIYIESIHPGVAVDIQNRINNGEFIAILADRIAPNSPNRAIEIDFFGKKARLPEGPFALAMSLDCPVFTFFSYFNESLGKHCAYWERLDLKRPIKREDRRSAIVNSASIFARTLEKHCQNAPYQWFNFYDFWANSIKLP